jgi:hypothetical protein
MNTAKKECSCFLVKGFMNGFYEDRLTRLLQSLNVALIPKTSWLLGHRALG